MALQPTGLKISRSLQGWAAAELERWASKNPANALDNDRELAAEVGLLLSYYAIIDLFILHIFATVSGQSKNAADVVLGRIKGNEQRLALIRERIRESQRPDKEHELGLINTNVGD
jgi:hypothetical protein